MSISTTTLTLNLTTKKGRVTDTTDYAALGLTVGDFAAKGLGTIYFGGEIIYQHNSVGDPLIDLEAGDTFFEFDLELDGNGDVANGVYAVDYSLRLAGSVDLLSVTEPDTLVVDTNLWLADYLVADNVLTVMPSDADVDVVSAVLNEAGDEVTITVTGTLDDTDLTFDFDITNDQTSASYTFAGCTQLESKVTFVSDCDYGDFGSFSVSNNTAITTETLVSLNCTINYPSWTGEDPIVVTTLPYSNNRLATGAYSVKLTEVISQTQTDGLILIYTAVNGLSGNGEEFNVSCAGSLCGLSPCIENLRAAHYQELTNNKISKYQKYVDNVNLYYIQAQTYKACGDLDDYAAAIAAIEATLDASGCECSCCDDTDLKWVQNTSASTITAIEELEAALQYRLYDGVPGATQDESLGVRLGAVWQNVNTGIEYRCTDPTAGAAVWEIYYNPSGDGPYVAYQALVTQSSTSDPTVDVLVNTLGATLTWDRASTGTYTIDADASVFTENATAVIFGAGNQNAPIYGQEWQSDTQIVVYTRNSATNSLADGGFNTTYVEIRVY
jgi:hypothetical protein